MNGLVALSKMRRFPGQSQAFFGFVIRLAQAAGVSAPGLHAIPKPTVLIDRYVDPID